MGLICDLCDAPIKDGKLTILIMVSEEDANKYNNLASFAASKKISADKKEICQKCKQILDYIFLKRKIAIKSILQKLEKDFKLSSK